MPVLLTLTETDTNSDCTGDAADKKATSGGTAGVTAVTINTAASGISNIGFFSAANEPNLSSHWGAGSWVTRLEITTANTNMTWTSINVFRLTSACVGIGGGTIVNATISISLGTTGVKSTTQTGVDDTASSPSATDRIQASLATQNAATMSTASWAFKPSQNIDTPIATGGASCAHTLPPLHAGCS